MFHLFRKIFSRADAPPPAEVSVGASEAPPPPPPVPAAADPGKMPAPPTTATEPAVNHPAHAGSVVLAVSALLPGLPEALRHRLAVRNGETLHIPLNLIVPQLAEGAVSLPLGELRRIAPEVFRGIEAPEQTAVPLPLAEVLPQIKPDDYPRRRDQKTITVPDDVTGLFGKGGHRVTFSDHTLQDTAPKPPVKPPASTTKPAPAPVPVQARPAPISPSPVPAARVGIGPDFATPARASTGNVTSAVGPRPLPSPGVALHGPVAPAAKPPAPIPFAPRPPLAPPVAQPTPPAPMSVSRPAPVPAPVGPTPPPTLPRPAPAPARPVAPAFGGEPLRVPLAQVSGGWPFKVQQDVANMGAAAATLLLPMDELEPMLKTGHVAFPWKRLSRWLEPVPSVPAAANAAEMVVELPLKVIAPLFLARHRAAAPQKRLDVDQSIPDLFSRTDAAQWAVSARAAATSAPAVPLGAPAPRVAGPTRTSPPAATAAAETAFDLNTVLGPPARRFPVREILQNVARLPGVQGALLAMSDGLLVNSSLPPTIKSELVAAFLPQMFGRMSQYARELSLGGLRGLTLAVEGGGWQIVRQSNIFFAVLCGPDTCLPLAQLAGIAAELNKQQQ